MAINILNNKVTETFNISSKVQQSDNIHQIENNQEEQVKKDVKFRFDCILMISGLGILIHPNQRRQALNLLLFLCIAMVSIICIRMYRASITASIDSSLDSNRPCTQEELNWITDMQSLVIKNVHLPKPKCRPIKSAWFKEVQFIKNQVIIHHEPAPICHPIHSDL